MTFNTVAQILSRGKTKKLFKKFGSLRHAIRMKRGEYATKQKRDRRFKQRGHN